MSQHTALELSTAHRPWPLPVSAPVMTQTWRMQLFAHWRVPHIELRRRVPEPLIIDEFDGHAWLGITPFHLTDLRIGPLPQLPVASDFPEINVRTYVRFGDKTGVYFFSLDAASQIAVLGARFTLGLPYFHADMHVDMQDGFVRYRSRRLEQPHAEFEAAYQPRGAPFNAVPGSLDHFLTERYALFTVPHPGQVSCVEIHHEPWKLQPAHAVIRSNTMAAVQGFTLPKEQPVLHFADRQETLIWAPQREG